MIQCLPYDDIMVHRVPLSVAESLAQRNLPMKPWHWFTLGLVWLGVSGALTACNHIGPPADPQAAPLAPAPYLSSLEKDVVQEINLARTQPKAYATFLEQLRPYYVGGHEQSPGAMLRGTDKSGRPIVVTTEGPRALDEAMAFLRSTSPLPPLEVSQGMSLGAKDHVKDLKTQKITDGRGLHQGRDGSQPGDRVNRYGRWQGTISENLAYGIDTARAMTVALIIDDGLPNRGHRKNIFDTQAHVVGAACDQHVAGSIICITTFAAGYTDNAQ